MNIANVKQFLLFGSAGMIALLVYFFSSQFTLEKSARKRVREMVDSGANSFFDRGGERITKKMKSGFLGSWKTSLYWAQVNGDYANWTVGGMLARGLVASVAVSFSDLIIWVATLCLGNSAIRPVCALSTGER